MVQRRAWVNVEDVERSCASRLLAPEERAADRRANANGKEAFRESSPTPRSCIGLSGAATWKARNSLSLKQSVATAQAKRNTRNLSLSAPFQRIRSVDDRVPTKHENSRGTSCEMRIGIVQRLVMLGAEADCVNREVALRSAQSLRQVVRHTFLPSYRDVAEAGERGFSAAANPKSASVGATSQTLMAWLLNSSLTHSKPDRSRDLIKSTHVGHCPACHRTTGRFVGPGTKPGLPCPAISCRLAASRSTDRRGDGECKFERRSRL